ncbi:MAG: NAD(P)-dependent oxidoreductase [Ramlibacter sp.]|nr:NAD(P)-dependent oxidoreductase [Ramlibacter sp.]
MGGTIGIVGVGNMGGGMAGRLCDRGWQVQVCDLVASRVVACVKHGARAAATPAEAAAGAEALIVGVVDAAEMHEVLFGAMGAAAALAPGAAVLLCPTVAPRDVERIAAALADRGLAAIDAPMSGGPARARDGSMSLMVACADAVFEARALALAERLGLDAGRTLDVIEQSSGQSWIGSDRMRRALAGDYAPRAHVTLLQKDTRLALEAALAAGFRPSLGPAAHEAFNRAVAAGDAELDDAALLRLFRKQ